MKRRTLMKTAAVAAVVTAASVQSRRFLKTA